MAVPDMELMPMEFTCNFQPQQIVSLQHEGAHLYAEVIQVIESRQMCWVRPLMLVFSDPLNPFLEPRLYDLRSSSDLLWPQEPFRSALDTEVIPLLQLLSLKPQSNRELSATQQLDQFIHQVWHAHPTLF